MSHPIGPASGHEEIVVQRDNLAIAHDWFKRLVQATRWALIAPWMAYLTALEGQLYGPRAMIDQRALIERSDILVQVGGWISPHMHFEMNHATRAGLRVVDLTDLGAKPMSEEFVAREIAKRSKDVEKLRRRRTWLPPLEDEDVQALQAAQVVLQADPYSEDARNVIQRIVVAAMRKT